jgi:hypothetical protein
MFLCGEELRIVASLSSSSSPPPPSSHKYMDCASFEHICNFITDHLSGSEPKGSTWLIQRPSLAMI